MIAQNNDFTSPINKLTTAVFSIFFLLLPVIFLQGVFETASIPRHILISGTACLLLFIFSIRFFIETPKLNFSILHFSLLIFFCWALLSLLWSEDRYNSITELTQLCFYFILVFFASQLKSNQIKITLNAIYIGASLAAMIGILQAFNLNPLELKMTTPLASTFNNKNHASVFFDLVIPLALISMLTNKGHEKFIASLAYTLAVTFILLAKTKGSLLSYFIYTLFFFAILYKNRSIQTQLFTKKNIAHYLFLSFFIPTLIYALTAISFFNLNTNTPKQWSAGLTKQSTSVRLAWYKNAYIMLKDKPLTGVGYGAFRQGFAPYASNPNIVHSLTEDQAVGQLHNDPYQIFLELGLVGGGLIVVIFSFIVFKSSELLTSQNINNKDSPDYLFLGCFLALIGSITHSFVDFPLRLPSSAALFWFITGLILVYVTKIKRSFIINNKKLKVAYGVITAIFAVLLINHSYGLYSRYFSASKLTYSATIYYQKEKNCSKAKSEIDQAVDLFFEDAFIRQRYVQVYSSCNIPADVKLSAMNKVLNYDSTNTRARLTRAILNLNNQKLALAQNDFSYVTYILPHRPAAYLGLGYIATMKKEYTNARKYYEKVLNLDPGNEKAHKMLKQFSTKGI